MADDPKQTSKADDSRINIEQDHEVQYWAEKLGVSREALRSAVAKAGPMVRDVRTHYSIGSESLNSRLLGQHPRSSWERTPVVGLSATARRLLATYALLFL